MIAIFQNKVGEINQMFFNSKEKALNFMSQLVEQDNNGEDYWIDCHYYYECGAYFVEWVCVPYSRDYRGTFMYIPFEEMENIELMLENYEKTEERSDE